METRELIPGLTVSRLCYGTLTLGPLQRGMAASEGGRLLLHALERGISFFDTAELYGTYPHLAVLVREYPGAVIATKSYAWDRRTAEESYASAARGIGRDMLDVFLLHEQESEHTIRGHWEALETFLRLKEKGHIRAVGLSTHTVEAALAALRHPEIDVVHPLLNVRGIGIRGGTRQEMEQAVEALAQAGRGVYLMKALGGGHLIGERREALHWALAVPGARSVAVGMQSAAEIDYNVALFEGRAPSDELEKITASAPRALFVHDWCTGCGRCVAACKAGAIRVKQGRAVPGQNCTLCGYCAAACPEFCLKVL